MKHGRTAYLATSPPIPNRVRCFTGIAALALGPLFTRPWNRDNKFAVFLGDEVFGATA
jgi:hypothetical protein